MRQVCPLTKIKRSDGDVACTICGEMINYDTRAKLDSVDCDRLTEEELTEVKEALASKKKSKPAPVQKVCGERTAKILRLNGITTTDILSQYSARQLTALGVKRYIAEKIVANLSVNR